MKHFILIIIIYSPTILFAQINGIVVDSKTREPIEYANIWVENQNIGTTSDHNGLFHFKENLIKKTLIVSAIGYESVQTILDYNPIRIELNPKTYIIEEVTVRPMKHNELIIDEFKKSSIHNYLMSNSRPWIIAKFFKYSAVYEKTLYIKSINILTDSEINNATFNLRLISANEKGEPTNDILRENLIVKAKKGKRKLHVDLTEFQIIFPKNGFFISVESLIIESNRREFIYTMEGSNKKIHSVQHDPKFGVVLCDENISNWLYLDGKWRNTKLNHKTDEKSKELAIELTLTD